MSRVIIVGQGASGKNYLANKYKERGFKLAISYTSRPKRSNETDGIDYFFISKEEFIKRIFDNFWYEYTEFEVEVNGIKEVWYYGKSHNEFMNSDIIIMDTKGIKQLKPEDRENSLIIFVNAPEHIRRKRLEKRQDADTVEGRLQRDREDFDDFKDYDVMIKNKF